MPPLLLCTDCNRHTAVVNAIFEYATVAEDGREERERQHEVTIAELWKEVARLKGISHEPY